jgi:uncharacterized protein YceK
LEHKGMMKEITTALAAVAVAATLSGCATAYMRTDLSGRNPKGLYPATRADVVGAYRYCANKSDPFGGWRGAGTPSHPNPLEKVLWVTVSVIDLPISLVTDTVCLPWDLSKKKKLEEAPTTKSTLSSEAAPSAAPSER